MTDTDKVDVVEEAPPPPKYAFRCKNCGRLETSANAGELEAPAACPICGHGVSYDPIRGLKQLHPENWEVLADMPSKDKKALAKDHGVEIDDIIEVHVAAEPVPTDREPMEISVTAEENLSTADSVDGGKS